MFETVPYKGYFNNVTYFTVLTKRGGNEKRRNGMKDEENKGNHSSLNFGGFH
jgi:hypothetical protein